jgi:hypothetical protein
MSLVLLKKTGELSDQELYQEFLKLEKAEFDLPKSTRRKVILK